MSKHTPGPWRVAQWHIQASREHGINPSIQHDLDICRVDPEDNMLAGERAANARLIAAAPDLLAALRTVLASCRKGLLGNRFYPEGWEAALAAIDKAEVPND